MALKKLSEKLDSIEIQDLGIDYSETKIWEKLDHRLSNRRYPIYWWFAAASILLLTLLPITVFKRTSPAPTSVIVNESSTIDTHVKSPLTGEDIVVENIESSDTHVVSMISPKRKNNLDLELATITNSINLKPVEFKITESVETEKSGFNQKDIAIIQASLESPTFKNGRKVTIRAQWHKSSDQLNVNNQALKIKLYEKNK